MAVRVFRIIYLFYRPKPMHWLLEVMSKLRMGDASFYWYVTSKVSLL